MWSGPEVFNERDVRTVADTVAAVTGFAPTRDVAASVMDSVHNSYRPKTGDIFTRLLLDREIPDQFSGKSTIMAEAVAILVENVLAVPSSLASTGCFSAWNGSYRSDMNRYDAPKLNLRRPPPTISMRY